MADPQFDVVVAGAGAGGILAAWRAAQLGAKVLLVEKTSRIGTKILISGGGKCNVAHAGPLEDVIKAFPRHEARFLRPTAYRLPNDRIMELMTDRGIELYTRDDGRVFPRKATAKDVVSVLTDYLAEAGVEVCLESTVVGVEATDRIEAIQIESTPITVKSDGPKGGFGTKALLREALGRQSGFGQRWKRAVPAGLPVTWCWRRAAAPIRTAEPPGTVGGGCGRSATSIVPVSTDRLWHRSIWSTLMLQGAGLRYATALFGRDVKAASSHGPEGTFCSLIRAFPARPCFRSAAPSRERPAGVSIGKRTWFRGEDFEALAASFLTWSRGAPTGYCCHLR